MNILEKAPGDLSTLEFDFDDVLAAGEEITGTPSISISPSGVTTWGSPAIDSDGRGITQQVSGGTMGTYYVITVTCGTDTGSPQLHDYEKVFILRVRTI